MKQINNLKDKIQNLISQATEKNEGLGNYYQGSKVFDRLNRFDELSSGQIKNLGDKIFSLLNWEKIKGEALKELKSFDGKNYEIKLDQRSIKNSKYLNDSGLRECVNDFLDHNFVGYYGDEGPSAIFDFSWDNWGSKVEWLKNEMVKELQAFILLELREKAHKKQNSEVELDKVYEVADCLGVDLIDC